jgi:hypothetical protein
MKWRIARLFVAGLVMLLTDFPVPLGGLRAADGPIGVITRGAPDVVLPASSTAGLTVRYGLGFPVQLGPKTAGLLCNLRVVGVGRTDYEDGTDVFVFDDLGKVGEGGPTPISRNEKEQDPATGEGRFIVKYPAVGGFWPLGAKQPDGSAHPGAGTGFALCQALSLVGDGQKLTWSMFSLPSLRCYTEVMQLAFDGQKVTVVKRDLIRTGAGWVTRDGWGLAVGGMQAAIPDGSDLLMAVSANKDGVNQTGVCRFQFEAGQWQPVTFTPVTSGAESSLVRRADQSLVFLTRAGADLGPEAPKSIMLWTSTDGGKTWQKLLQAPNLRPQTPVSVNVTPDGTIYVLANVIGMTNAARTVQWWHMDRARLAMWQLADGAGELKPAQVIRDCWEELGPPPDETMWYVDHATSGVVRLGDERWHGLVAYRLLAFSIYGDKVGEAVTPHTGCYVEETPSAAPVTPPWRF